MSDVLLHDCCHKLLVESAEPPLVSEVLGKVDALKVVGQLLRLQLRLSVDNVWHTYRCFDRRTDSGTSLLVLALTCVCERAQCWHSGQSSCDTCDQGLLSDSRIHCRTREGPYLNVALESNVSYSAKT